jgi:hypothetical protein
MKVGEIDGGDDIYFSEGLCIRRAGLPAGGVGIVAYKKR